MFGLVGISFGAVPLDGNLQQLFQTYCYDCHGLGSEEGGVQLDELTSDFDASSDLREWIRVWRNLRSHLMPPIDAVQPSAADRRKLLDGIEQEIFRLDPHNPDPGVVTLRRLNRDEYRFSILDWLGIDFDTDDMFPPDDTGYGFDTVADAMTLSPMLMEKYLDAAEGIAARAVHVDGPQMAERELRGDLFKSVDKSATAKRLDMDAPIEVSRRLGVHQPGEYVVRISLRVAGAMTATAQTARLAVVSNGQEVAHQQLGWDVRQSIDLEQQIRVNDDAWHLGFVLQPGDPPNEGEERLWVAIDKVRIVGPVDAPPSEYPPHYGRIFSEGSPTVDQGERAAYARRILQRLAERAFRGPVESSLLEGLVSLADIEAEGPQSFERGIARALVAILSSPRFLFRCESPVPKAGPPASIPVSEFVLASRLSYFLWRSLPDDTLFDLARRGRLRERLETQVERMIDDPRFDRFAASFVGQWLQVNNVESTFVNTRAILRNSQRNGFDGFNRELRDAIRSETTMFFAHLVRERKPPTELLTADYSFLNARLAELYGIAGVDGDELRYVSLADHAQRGGVLTQASVLIVTSNPTRTSPVKRGLFVLENLLGTPTPPPPPDVPAIEIVQQQMGRQATMRALMETHRSRVECASCHSRMDPLGLAMENYNALGMWRDKEHGQPLDTQGQLMTGETFSSARELAEVLSADRRDDFLRCLTEKMLTYALGRGLEYFDGPCVDEIVGRLKREDASMRTLIHEIIGSVPFQRMRTGQWEEHS